MERRNADMDRATREHKHGDGHGQGDTRTQTRGCSIFNKQSASFRLDFFSDHRSSLSVLASTISGLLLLLLLSCALPESFQTGPISAFHQLCFCNSSGHGKYCGSSPFSTMCHHVQPLPINLERRRSPNINRSMPQPTEQKLLCFEFRPPTRATTIHATLHCCSKFGAAEPVTVAARAWMLAVEFAALSQAPSFHLPTTVTWRTLSYPPLH